MPPSGPGREQAQPVNYSWSAPWAAPGRGVGGADGPGLQSPGSVGGRGHSWDPAALQGLGPPTGSGLKESEEDPFSAANSQSRLPSWSPPSPGCLSRLMDTVRETTETPHRLRVTKDSDKDEDRFFTHEVLITNQELCQGLYVFDPTIS